MSHQRIDLVPLDHGAHQGERFRRDAKTQWRESRCESRSPQHAHRILGEGGRNVAQQPRLDIGGAAVGIDKGTVAGARHGVDGQVAPREILLEGHPGAEFHREAAIAGCDFALQACERVFLVGLGVQEHGKVAAHLAVAAGQQLLAGCPHHHPIAFPDRHTEQRVPDGTANQIHLHG